MFSIKKLNIKDRAIKLKNGAKSHVTNRKFSDFLTLAAMIIGVFALFTLIYFYVRPIKTNDVKVPVATDQSTYAPGEDISGIFFGEVFYEGRVKILREVFCTNYKATIEPPKNNAEGSFFETISTPRKLEGLTVPIGQLPKNIPVGVNCVLRFTNLYEIQTPFGIRRIEYAYYTQNFSIISQQRRDILDCEAAGGTDCVEKTEQTSVENTNQTSDASSTTIYYGAPNSAAPDQTTNNTTNNTTTNNSTTNNPPAEPITPPRQCAINALGLHLICN